MAKLSKGDELITGASVSVEVKRHNGVIDNIMLYDDGSHGDNIPNDGYYSNRYDLSKAGNYYFSAIASGGIGEVFERVWFMTLRAVPPIIALSISPIPNTDGWNKTDVAVLLAGIDGENGQEVREIHYTLSGASSGGAVVQGKTAEISVGSEGSTTLTYWAIDNTESATSGNSSDKN